MCQTLFYIPDRLLGLPVFGWGVLLAVWVLVAAGWIGWQVRQQGWTREVQEYLPFAAIVAVVVVFLFPRLEAVAADGSVLGLPIRGYGTMMLCGVVAGWWLAARRATDRGFTLDALASLGLHVFVAGILGARLFFVIEYWEDFARPTWRETIVEIAKFTEGGLVVYGSLLGGFAAFLWFAHRNQLPWLRLADAIAPGVVLGMAIGRIGCLLNGCCYGGLCEHGAPGIQFPRFNSPEQQVTSPPYAHQQSVGQLHGFTLGGAPEGEPVVRHVDAEGAAERAGLRVGDALSSVNNVPVATLKDAQRALLRSGGEIALTLSDGRRLAWSIGAMPSASRPVHPSQIYSAVSGLLICLFLLAADPYCRRDGAVVAALFTLYPVLRFLEELIRDDEPGQLGTAFTVSQWISFGVLLAAGGLWAWIGRVRQPRAA